MEAEQVNSLLTFDSPKSGQSEKHEQIAEKAKEFALLVNDLCPDTREKKLALVNIQQSVVMANASLARSGDPLAPQSLAGMREFAGGQS